MASEFIPAPLTSLRVSRHRIPAHMGTPNTSIQNQPLLVYHSAFPADQTTASAIESHLKSVGVVVPQWRFTMYSTSHFHSNTHEVLSIADGRALCLFGGEDNPGNVKIELSKGDVVVVPAGVAHRLWQDKDGGFQMVGSYPPGKNWDMCYGGENVEGINQLGWFHRDPIYGDSGPTLSE